jgi:hypothetical protein
MRAKATTLDPAWGPSPGKSPNSREVNVNLTTDVRGTPGKVVLQSAIPITEYLWHDATQIL